MNKKRCESFCLFVELGFDAPLEILIDDPQFGTEGPDGCDGLFIVLVKLGVLVFEHLAVFDVFGLLRLHSVVALVVLVLPIQDGYVVLHLLVQLFQQPVFFVQLLRKDLLVLYCDQVVLNCRGLLTVRQVVVTSTNLLFMRNRHRLGQRRRVAHQSSCRVERDGHFQRGQLFYTLVEQVKLRVLPRDSSQN